jgi:hypothetical protein
MARSRVDEVGAGVLEALERGESVRTAAARAHVSEDTVRSWIQQGRDQPEGRFGRFAVVMDGRDDRRSRWRWRASEDPAPTSTPAAEPLPGSCGVVATP